MQSHPFPADPETIVDDLWSRIEALVAELSDEQWQAPTPCAAWDVADLAAHLSAVQTLLDGSTPQPETPDGWSPPAGADAVDAWTAAGVAARSSWSVEERTAELATAHHGHVERVGAVSDWSAAAMGPIGQTTEAGLLEIRCFDLWVHLQDLREVIGAGIGDRDAPGAVLAHRFVAERIPWLFGKQAGAPEGATLRITLGSPLLLDRVLHVVGGRAAWDDDADPGDGAVTGDPAGHTLLCAGRPASWTGPGPGGTSTWTAPGCSRSEEELCVVRQIGGVTAPRDVVTCEIFAVAALAPDAVWGVVGDLRAAPLWTDAERVESAPEPPVHVGAAFTTVSGDQRTDWRVITADRRLIEAVATTPWGRLGLGIAVHPDPLGTKLILAGMLRPARSRVLAHLVHLPALRGRFDRWTEAAFATARDRCS